MQHVKVTKKFRVILYNTIPKDKCTDIYHTRVVCEICLGKDDPNRTRITVNGGYIY